MWAGVPVHGDVYLTDGATMAISDGLVVPPYSSCCMFDSMEVPGSSNWSFVRVGFLLFLFFHRSLEEAVSVVPLLEPSIHGSR